MIHYCTKIISERLYVIVYSFVKFSKSLYFSEFSGCALQLQIQTFDYSSRLFLWLLFLLLGHNVIPRFPRPSFLIQITFSVTVQSLLFM